MEDKYILINFIIFMFYTFSEIESKLSYLNITKVSNLQDVKMNFAKSHLLFEFNCTPYFENDTKGVYIFIKARKQQSYPFIFIYYDK